MGTKAEISTVEGMRKAMHDAVDDFFDHLPQKEDGTPTDAVRLHSEVRLDKLSDRVSIQSARMVGCSAEFARPRLLASQDAHLTIMTREGKFGLVNQSNGSLNAMVRLFVDTLGGMSEEEIAQSLNKGAALYTDMSITELTRRANLVFEALPADPLPVTIEPVEPEPPAPPPASPPSEPTTPPAPPSEPIAVPPSDPVDPPTAPPATEPEAPPADPTPTEPTSA